ncbi:MAG: hypothetical protein JSS24_11675 [Proteobacteria bacterium]|nr:hypothetical protein [Pseudomonadota bacterium]
MSECLFLQSSCAGRRLRVAVLLDNSSLIGPFAAILRQLQTCNFADPVLVLADDQDSGTAEECGGRNALLGTSPAPRTAAPLLYSRYLAWDKARHASAALSFVPENYDNLLQDIARVEGRFLDGSDAALDITIQRRISEAQLDVILNLSRRTPRPALAQLARCGLWSCQFGTPERWGDFATFWAVSQDEPLSSAFLMAQTGPAHPNIALAECRVATQLGTSHVVNLHSICLSIDTLMIWKLRQLYEQGWQVLRDTPARAAKTHAPAVAQAPENLQMAGFLARKFTRALRHRLHPDRRVRRWQIGIRKASTQAPWQGDWDDFRWITPAAGHFYADPHLFEHAGRLWLFMEDYPYRLGHGIISCCELREDGTLGPVVPVLHRPYHLSFPYVFKREDEIYLLPETARSGRVELYRAVDFPRRWKLHRVLLDIPAHDTVLHVGEDGTHYFFTGIRQSVDSNEHQFLFTASSLQDPLQPHPRSPVSLDARYSRNAGPLLQFDGKLIRVSQDSTIRYGRQLRFSEVEALTPDDFREREVGQRAPAWGPEFIGTHSYCRLGGWEVMDALRLALPENP